LVDKIGPSEDSGLYEITDRGHAVLKHREKYDNEDEDVDFDQLIDEKVDELDEDTDKGAPA
jgi:DNA-binding PadR family transcriptional regulator